MLVSVEWQKTVPVGSMLSFIALYLWQSRESQSWEKGQTLHSVFLCCFSCLQRMKMVKAREMERVISSIRPTSPTSVSLFLVERKGTALPVMEFMRSSPQSTQPPVPLS